MWPAGILDKSSGHEDQKECPLSSGQIWTYARLVEGSNPPEVTPAIARECTELSSRWLPSNAIAGEPLSDAIVKKLTDLRKRMSLAAISYEKCVRACEDSQYCISECTDTMIRLKFWTGFINEFVSNDKHNADVIVEFTNHMAGLLECASLQINAVRLKLDIKCGEFDESEWSQV